LGESDEFCPVYSLGVAEQSALLLGVTKEIR
jgi:hypothetical protein